MEVPDPRSAAGSTRLVAPLHPFAAAPVTIGTFDGSSGFVVIEAPESGRLEYWLIVENPRGDLFTDGVLTHADGEGGDEVVATFFVDAGLRDRRLKVRGSLSVPHSTDPKQLAAEIRAQPGAFRVLLRSAQSPGGAWEGRLRSYD
jgi:hypothetical protein